MWTEWKVTTTVMATRNVYVWLTILSDAMVDKVVARLVRKGYHVGPISENIVIGSADSPAHVMGMSLTHEKNELDPGKVRDEVKDFLIKENILFYSLIVSQPVGSGWCLGNIKLSEARKTKPSHLAVVKPFPKGPFRKDDGIIDDEPKKPDTKPEDNPPTNAS